MRFFFMGPRIFGIRPGVILGASDFRKAFGPSASRNNMTGSFVYVITGAAGHHKIGVSTDPIARLATLQTGSPVPLRFAFIGATQSSGYDVEAAAHELLDAYRKEGEWFLVPASIAIGAALEAASRLGEPIQQCRPEIVPEIIRQANAPDVKAGGEPWWLTYLIYPLAVGIFVAVVAALS